MGRHCYLPIALSTSPLMPLYCLVQSPAGIGPLATVVVVRHCYQVTTRHLLPELLLLSHCSFPFPNRAADRHCLVVHVLE